MTPPGDDAPPPRGETGAGGKVSAGSGTKANATPHDPALCATCLLGIQPWTPKRRNEAAITALRLGRRVCDLPEVSR